MRELARARATGKDLTADAAAPAPVHACRTMSAYDTGMMPSTAQTSEKRMQVGASRWGGRRYLLGALLLAHALGFVSSFDALMSTRTAPGAVAWIVSLNTFPYVAVPAYWVFGRTKFQGYVIGRQRGDTVLNNALHDKMALVHPYKVSLPPGQRHVQAMERLAKMPMVGGNRVELLVDGEATFRSLFAGIEGAERYILVQFYIVRDDRVGRELKRLLEEKARAGVKVRFLYDEIGSYQLPRTYVQELAAAGVDVRPFHSTRGSGNRFQLNFRNHRKVVVVDGRLGWLGGLNVGDEYLGRDAQLGEWRDTHLLMEGPATICLQLSFVEDWHWASGEILQLDWVPSAVVGSGVPVLVLPSGPADRFETASLMVQHAINSATSRLWISSPYFVPDEGVIGALKLAALRGVDVRILIPERPDNPLTYFAAYAFIGPLLEVGVKVYRYQAGFLHGKAFLIDGLASAVGTVNLDNRSFRLNFEITAWVMDPDFASRVEAMFHTDFTRARLMTREEIEERSLWFRAASRGAYLTAPLL
jgi:cardiolipin synthase A/B